VIPTNCPESEFPSYRATFTKIRAKWYKILGARDVHDVNAIQREPHVMWADSGLGLANHGCQVSVPKFQISSTALLPTILGLPFSKSLPDK